MSIKKFTTISSSLLKKIIYLLRYYQSDNCDKWKKGIGNCKNSKCKFCETEKCIMSLENKILM